jgi:predicted neuraminidase
MIKLLLSLAFLTTLACAQPIPGGYSPVAPTDADALAAAKFAVAKHDAKLSFQALEKAAHQVVAGMNYRLTLRVLDAGKVRSADAVVWRKLGNAGHELTSWKWLDAPPPPAAVLKTEFIYETAPFPSCHASTIVELPGGGLVTAWFGGTREKHPDVGIWVSRLEGGKWTAPVEIANGVQPPKADGSPVRHPTWNPVLFQPKTGPLLLFYKVGPSPQTWWGELRSSADGGKTWSAARRLPEGILGPIKNKPVQLPNGDLLSPTSSETDEKPSKWAVHFERSTDLGATWTRTPALHDGLAISAIQPSILFLGGDQLLALGRTRQGKLFQISSDDAGKSWGAISLTTLPNPSSGTDAVTLRDGRHLLIYNHTAKGRSPLNLALSKDGKTWQAALALEGEPGEYSYPAIIQTRDGLVHATWTWKRLKVKHAVIDPAKLEPRAMVNGEWPTP